MQRSIRKIHSQRSLSPHASRRPFLHPLPFHQFLFFSTLLLSTKLRAASQSTKKEVGLTPLAKVIEKWLEQQATVIYSFYLFICLDVIWRRGWGRGEKQYSFFLMGLPSTDNVPVLFPFSWISRATKCAGNAKCRSCSSKHTQIKLLFINHYIPGTHLKRF